MLADDNFASIAAAVRDGRTVYDNLKKVISLELLTNASYMHLVVLAPLPGLALPITAVQILWVSSSHPYDIWFVVLDGLLARFWNAGHLLGSASVEVELAQAEGDPLRILFSADIGPDYKLMHTDKEGPNGVDYLFCEATYGDRDRIDATAGRRRQLLCDEVRAATHPHGALLIPYFAVERALELISDLGRLIAEDALPQIPIHVESPLATKATRVFAKHHRELEKGAVLMRGLKSPHLHFTETREQSIALDRVAGFHIFIAASGMCDAGRIRHRRKNWLWRDEPTVLFTGFQAVGTLGRILQGGAKCVRI